MERHNVSGDYKNYDSYGSYDSDVGADDFDDGLPLQAISAIGRNGNSTISRELLDQVLRQWGKENNFDSFTQVSTGYSR